MSDVEKFSTLPVNNPSTQGNRDVRVSYMRRYYAQCASDRTDWDRARVDALNLLAALDESELNARIFVSPWRTNRLRDALIVLAAAVPPETPISQIGHVA